MNKTPEYTRRAIDRYHSKTLRKTVTINKEKNKELAAHLENEQKPFSELVIELLNKHYNL